MTCGYCLAELTRADTYVVRTNETTEVKCGKCTYVLDTYAPLFESAAQQADPTVIARGPNGEIRFLPRTDAPIPEGFMRQELRTLAEKDAFEREVNANERARHESYMENRDRAASMVQERNRSELRARMQHMSQFGKDFARTAIDQNNNRVRGRFDAGFHIESSHYNASNRDGEVSERTNWKRRK